MFLIDKYTINNPWDVKYNKGIFKKILKLDTLYSWNTEINTDDDFNNLPNILVYGQPGNGKKSLVRLLIKRMFGKNIQIMPVTYSINGYGSNNLEISIQQSLYHIEINPTGTGLDKYLVQEVIKKYANRKVLNFTFKRSFKIIWIHNIHKLSYYAQTALRCTMEKFSHTCKFILTGSQLTKVLKPLRSRCLIFRMASPTKQEILSILMNISYLENNFLNFMEYDEIIDNCEYNIKNAIWELDFKFNGVELEKSWKVYLSQIIVIIKNIINKKFLQTYVKEIRNILYKIFITNIDGNDIIKEILDQVLTEFKNYKLDYEIINICTQYNHALAKGKRSIIHLEAFIYCIIDLLFRNKMKKTAK